MNNQLFLLLIAPFILVGQQAQNVWPPKIKIDVSYIYKKTNDIDLNLWVFNPPESMPNDPKPAIVFFWWRLAIWQPNTICSTLQILKRKRYCINSG